MDPRVPSVPATAAAPHSPIVREVAATVSPAIPRTLLPTLEAAHYCGFKTTGALRKAHMEARISPVGRRGGRGTYMWSIESLDRFLRGEPPAKVEPERSGEVDPTLRTRRASC